MTVSTTNNRITYSGNGVTTIFSFPYKFFLTSDLNIYVGGVLQMLTTNYTVSTPTDSGANVTFLVAPPSGSSNVVILRNPDLLQQSALKSNGKFPAETVEDMVDKSTIQIQRLSDLSSRSLRLADSDSSTVSTSLPNPEANKVLGWNPGASGLQNYGPSDFATLAAGGNPTTQYFSGNGVTLSFVLSSNPVSLPNVEVFISGVRQSPGIDYTLSGTTVTFLGVAPPGGTNNILMRWVNAVGSMATISDGSVTTSKLSDGVLSADAAGRLKMADGFVTTAKIASQAVTNALLADAYISDLTTVAFDYGNDFTSISDASDSGKKKKALLVPFKLFDIAASVAANALTITVNPTTLEFRNSTLTNGTPSLVSITTPITLTVPNTATLGTTNATAAVLDVLVLNNAGATEVAVVNRAGGVLLDENLISTTIMNTSSDSNNVVYSTTARANVAYRYAGSITLTEATAGVWATAPTVVQGAGGLSTAVLSAFGVGQTYQNVTGSRVAATTYFNTTGKTIQVCISYTGTGMTTALLINGATIQGLSLGGAATASLSVPVPPGASYSSTMVSVSSFTWYELR